MNRLTARTAALFAQISLAGALALVGVSLFTQNVAASNSMCCGDQSCEILLPTTCTTGSQCSGDVDGVPINTCCSGSACNID
jgi:hypothetical protein